MIEYDNKKAEHEDKILTKLRRRIYSLESLNLHKKEPKKDKEMVDELIRTIHLVCEEEDDE